MEILIGDLTQIINPDSLTIRKLYGQVVGVMDRDDQYTRADGLDHSWSCAKKLLRASGGPKHFSSSTINTLEKPVPMLYKKYCDVTLT